MNRNLFKKYMPYVALSVLGTLVLFSCLYLDSISILQTYDGKQVPWSKAGDVATFKVNGSFQPAQNSDGTQLVFSFLAPMSWNVALNAKATYNTNLADNPDQELAMSVAPISSLPKNGSGRTWAECLSQEYGVGPNVLADMEWVTFYSDQSWDIINNGDGFYEITLRVPVGEQELQAYLGFFINHTNDGFSTSSDHKKIRFSDEPFQVVEGKGPMIDYCNDHYYKVQPLSFLQDDFVTFTFNGGIDFSNPLTKSRESVYFQATGYTNNGSKYEVNEKSAKTLMTKESASSESHSITFWPADFFGLQDGETLTHIEYCFTNKNGNIVISKTDDDLILGEPVNPNSETPFTAQLQCD